MIRESNKPLAPGRWKSFFFVSQIDEKCDQFSPCEGKPFN